jgi:hypothetical protein
VSQENVEAFQRAADAVCRGDAAAVAEMSHPDGVFEPLRAATEGAFVDPAGMRTFSIGTVVDLIEGT